jgi:hypothetical protein
VWLPWGLLAAQIFGKLFLKFFEPRIRWPARIPKKRAAETFRSRLRAKTINFPLSLASQHHGRGGGVGRGRGVGACRGVGVGLGVIVAVGVAVAVAVAVGVGVGEGDAQGLTGQVKASTKSIGEPPVS